MNRLTYHEPNGKFGVVGMNEKNENQKLYACVCKLKDYENLGLSPSEMYDRLEELHEERDKLRDDFESTLSELYDVTAERDKLRKAFALACRIQSDDYGCPAENRECAFPECDGETERCGNAGMWECWQRFFLEIVDSEQVCRVCGCTQENACPGGCWWVESDLCSACAGERK